MQPSKSLTRLNQAAYDQIAPLFAEKNGAMSEALAAQAARFRAHLPAAPARMLDLGCGTGRDLAWFEAHGCRGFGSDLSRGMLDLARQAARAPLCQMDMRFLGFAPASFQAVWCCAALLHLPKREAPLALAEIARVLVPGGFLSLSVQKGDSEGIERAPYTGTVERFFARYQIEEMAALIQAAGYTILQQGENESGRLWLWFDARLNRNAAD